MGPIKTVAATKMVMRATALETEDSLKTPMFCRPSRDRSFFLEIVANLLSLMERMPTSAGQYSLRNVDR